MTESIARLLIYLGLSLVVLGGVLLLLGRAFDFGTLPGDLAYEGENVRVYVPIGSMIVASIVLSVLLTLVLRLFR